MEVIEWRFYDPHETGDSGDFGWSAGQFNGDIRLVSTTK